MMIKRKNNLDEMQEQKLLKIEHNGMWLAFWGLFITITVQSILDKGNSAGECIVLMCLCIYTLGACLKNGIWDRKLKANNKTNLIVSIIASILMGGVFFISSYLKYEKLLGSIATGIFIFGSIFVLTFISLTICSTIYKKRVKKIEDNCESKSHNN